MDGKCRRYVAPPIGSASAPKPTTAAAAAAEAAARRLVNLRGSTVTQHQTSHYHGDGEFTTSSGPHQGLPSLANVTGRVTRSALALARPGDLHEGLSPASLASSSPPVLPSYVNTQQQQQQQQHQHFSPNSAHFLQSGFPDVPSSSSNHAHQPSSASPRPPYSNFLSKPMDASADARARAAAAAAAFSAKPYVTAGHAEHVDQNGEGTRQFTLPRPDSFCATGSSATSNALSSAATAAATAAAAAAARLRGTKGHDGASFHSISHASSSSSATSHVTLSPTPASVPLPPPSMASLQRPVSATTTAAAAPAHLSPESRQEAHTHASPVHPSKRERDARAEAVSGLKASGVRRPLQRTKTEAHANAVREGKAKSVGEIEDASGSNSSRSSSSSSSSSASFSKNPHAATAHSPPSALASSTIHEVAAISSENKAHLHAVAGVEVDGEALASEPDRRDPLRVVISTSALSQLLYRVTAPASPSVEERERTGEEEEESETVEAKLALDGVAQAADKKAPNTTSKNAPVKESEDERERLRAILQERDRASLRRRIDVAATLPPPPATLLLELLEQLPAAPRRAVHSREKCPCTAKEGFSEAFYECVQQVMTRSVLQRDGRVCDSSAIKQPSSASSTAKATSKGARGRQYKRAKTLENGLPTDVRDVVAFARSVVQQQQQQQQQQHGATSKSNGRSNSKQATDQSTTAPAMHTGDEEKNSALPDAQLSPLKALVEAKLQLIRPGSIDIDSGSHHAATAESTRTAEGQRHGEEAAGSPAPEPSSGGNVSNSLAKAHQHFINIARVASSSRQNKAEAARQAEQRLAASATAWREALNALLKKGGEHMESLTRRVTDWGQEKVQAEASEETLQRLQQLFFPEEAEQSSNAQREQQPWDSRKMLRKARNRARAQRHILNTGLSGGQLELPVPPFNFSFASSREE